MATYSQWSCSGSTPLGDICGWKGINCANCGNVTQLKLNSLGLAGTIPSSLGNLENALIINFKENNLFGTLPSQLGYITSLVLLALESNQLEGSIPESIGNLKRLKYLFISRNKFTANIPTSLCTTKITHASIAGNSDSFCYPSCLANSLVLSGSVPSCGK